MFRTSTHMLHCGRFIRLFFVVCLALAVLPLTAGCNGEGSTSTCQEDCDSISVLLGDNDAPNTAFQSSSDDEGNIYVVGRAQSPLFGEAKQDENYGGFLAKYDSSGNLDWGVQLNTPGDDISVNDVAVSNGAVVIVGTTRGAIAGTSMPDVKDGFVARYDASGNQQWLKTITAATPGSKAAVEPLKLAAGQDGNFYVTGISNGGVAFEGSTMTRIGNRDGFLLAVTGGGDAAGKITPIGAAGASVYASGITVDAAGSIYVSGVTDTSLSDSPLQGQADAVVVKFSRDMSVTWVRNIGMPGRGIIASSIAYSPANDSLYGVGYYIPDGSDGQSSNSRLPYAVSLSPATGERNWLTDDLASEGRSEFIDVAADADGNLIAVGYTDIDLFNGGDRANLNDAICARFDSSGKMTDGKQLGVDSPESAATFTGVTTFRGSVLASGSSTFGTDPENPKNQTGSGAFAILMMI